MLRALDQTDERLIAVRISEQLTSQDYVVLRTLFNDRLEQYDGLRWYVEMTDFEGWGPEDLWADFMLELHHADNKPLHQVAFVGDKKWEDWIARSCT